MTKALDEAVRDSKKSYEEAIMYLHAVGMIDNMRKSAAPKAIAADSPNYQHQHLVECGRVAGYTQAIEDLTRYIEDKISISKPAKMLTPTYGAAKKLIAAGKASKEQIDDYRKQSIRN